MIVTVSLDVQEIREAAHVGVERQIENLHRTPAYGTKRSPWGLHVEGALGEKAVAKYLGRYWTAVVSNPWTEIDGDVGSRVQVRTTNYGDTKLWVRPADKDGDAFVLVRGPAPKFRLLGWCYGYEAKDEKYRAALDPNRPTAFYVPNRDLRPVETLRGVLRAIAA